MVDLYEHNQKAYESAVAMLAKNQKAAIIHPTGTGKSFIGFKYCEDHPNERICWLSPSAYIFETQSENWQKAGGEEIKNIQFFTYAKMMMMDEAEIEAIQPDLIVLDEFHRAGAEFWGQGVNHLLSVYQDVPILGLSATAIRYLDNQRNMADELFEGYIASEMTLGEAIVRGILNPPKYVLSVFSYQKDLERYEKRVQKAKSKAVRDAAQVYLDALRRALEKADGMDVIFKKHMHRPHGKYLVFCSNKEHMDEMMGYVDEWFGELDAKPQVYSLYTNDPSTEQSFRDFKADDSDHLRLLYCIDALNEGIHVEGINGVILLRPTVSPIIYKQQIGRALTAGCDEDAVIFDIVMNIDNLYSIGAIEEEMEIALKLYESRGDHDAIINEHFKVLDEVRDCREAFRKLEDTLSANWELMFACAREYYYQYATLEISPQYKTKEGYSLGRWIQTQRRVRSGYQKGHLSDEQIRRLDEIGMIWEGHHDHYWNRNYEAAKEFYSEHGHLRVNGGFVTDAGIKLGVWIARLRRAYNLDYIRDLSEDRIDALNAIGMVWNVDEDAIQRAIEACRDYYALHGDLLVPIGTEVNGIQLGTWISNQRKRYKEGVLQDYFTQEQIKDLDEMGMVWKDVADHLWLKGYEACLHYYRQYQHLDVARDFVSDTGFELGKWIRNQRNIYKRGMAPEKVEKLNAIGMIWDLPAFWEKCYSLCEAYYQSNKVLDIKSPYFVRGIDLGRWLNEQRCIAGGGRTGKKLSDEQIKRLDAIGMDWKGHHDRQWDEMFERASAYFKEHDSLLSMGNETDCDGSLMQWLSRQRRAKNNGSLSKERIRQLDNIGMVWDVREAFWQSAFQRCKDYVAEYGDCMIKSDYRSADHFMLGSWIYKQRREYSKGNLSDAHIRLLDEIGMVWDVREAQWQQGYLRLKDYYTEHQSLPPVLYVTDDGYQLGEWTRVQRRKYQSRKLSDVRVKMLSDIGIRF